MPSIRTGLTPRGKSVAVATVGLAVVATIAGIAGYVAGLLRSAPPLLTLPAAKDVCFVVARAFNSQREEPDLAPFMLPTDAFAELLAKFEPSTKATLPVLTPPIGAAWVIDCDNRAWSIEWYWNGKNPLEFAVNGVRYQHVAREAVDGGTQMDIFVRKLQAALETRLSAPADAPIIQGPRIPTADPGSGGPVLP